MCLRLFQCDGCLTSIRSISPGHSISTPTSLSWTTRSPRVSVIRVYKYSAAHFRLIVDAHVGKALFHGAIAALAKRGKTVIFVTHALHFLSFCDYIYTLDAGHVAEQGTYQELVIAQGELARLDQEFGGNDPGTLAPSGSQAIVLEEVQSKSSELQKRNPGKGTLEGKLIVKEVRNTGTIAKNGTFALPSLLRFVWI